MCYRWCSGKTRYKTKGLANEQPPQTCIPALNTRGLVRSSCVYRSLWLCWDINQTSVIAVNEFTFIVSWDLKSGFCHLHAYSVGCNDSRSTSECNVCFTALSDCGSFLKYIITGSGGNRNSNTVVSTMLEIQMFQSQYIRDLF